MLPNMGFRNKGSGRQEKRRGKGRPGDMSMKLFHTQFYLVTNWQQDSIQEKRQVK